MHPTAMDNGRLFFERYVTDAAGKTIVDVGAQSVNGSLRDVSPPGARYLDVDFAAGEGVDMVLVDPLPAAVRALVRGRGDQQFLL